MRSCILIFWGILFLTGHSQAQRNAVEKITIENGLSQGMIFDIFQTRDGFLWVGTKDGLNRYDGYNFKVFSNDPFDPYSIVENAATALFEDSKGRLWVGLQSRGVDVYDPKTGRFHHFPLDSEENLLFKGSFVSRIVEGKDGAIWVSKVGGKLFRIQLPSAWEKEMPREPLLQNAAEVKSIALPLLPEIGNPGYLESLYDMYFTSDNQLMVMAMSAEIRIDPLSLKVERSEHAPQWFPRRIGKMIQGDPAYGGDLWVIDFEKIRRMHQGNMSVYPLPKLSPEKFVGLSRGKAGHVWLSVNHELWDLAPGDDFQADQPDVRLDAAPSCWMYDRNDNFWIGTHGYGLRKINPVKSLFHAGAEGKSLNRLWMYNGKYFVKILDEIYGYDPETGKLSNLPLFRFNGMRHVNMLAESSGAIWLLSMTQASENAFLCRYAPGNYQTPELQVPLDLYCDQFSPLLRSPDGAIWVLGKSCAFASYDPVAQKAQYYNFGFLFGKKATAVHPIAFCRDANGVFWIGTQLGLVKAVANVQGFDFQLIQTDPQNRGGLNCNSIACLLPDNENPAGMLWIGTKGGGINLMDTKSGVCRRLGTAEGLLNNVVYGILPGGRADEYWCSTNRGLAKIQRKPGEKFEVTTYTAALGLQDNEFNTTAYFKAENGELLFGGVNGLNRFFPETLRLDTTPPPVYIVGLEVNNTPAEPGGLLPAPLSHLSRLELPFDQNNISFEFAALDFTDPSKNRYRYRLEGLENNWIEAGAQRFAHFSHLAPGVYTFRVQGNNGESRWQDASPIVLVIHPPWWRSNTAYIAYFILVAWLVWSFYQLQIKRVKEREQLAFERRETERMKSLEQLKANFFSNVTHEFRTPLTLIIEPLRQLIQHPGDPDRMEKVKLAEKNSRQLLGLVNQLLDMAKLENGQMSIEWRRDDVRPALREIFERFLPAAEKRGIKLSLFMADDVPVFDYDPGKVETILNNLISNALKFTPEGGKVEVECKKAPAPTGGGKPSVQLLVRDTGPGIPAYAQGRVFERFYQVHTETSGKTGEGTGIGLALSKELAELMHGGILLKSEPGKGSIFTLWLPLEDGKKGESQPERSVPEAISGATGSTIERFEQGAIALVIEDNPDLRQFIKTTLGGNWQIVEAADGEEGIVKALELLPDIIISDLMMPKKDGYEVCDTLKNNELTAHIPLILLTAKTGLEPKLRGLRKGADDYLSKPFSTEELLTRMQNLVAQRRRLRQIFWRQFLSTEVAGRSPEEGEYLTQPDRDFMQRCYRLLDQNLQDQSLGVEALAQKMGISRVQLHRKLKALTNQSPIDFIRRFRLERAMTMLQRQEGSVGEISRKAGFVNEKYFSTVFKEHFGKSPSEV